VSSRKLRNDLIARKNWTKQQLSTRAIAIKRQSPMSTATAHAVIAHQAGMNVAKYLVGDDLREVRDAITTIGSRSTNTDVARNATSSQARRNVSSNQAATRTVAVPNVRVSDPILPAARIEQAREMARCYIILHVLENSMREVIQRVMRNSRGVDWWQDVMSRGSLTKIRDKAMSRQAKEQTARWHQTRGDHPLDYTDLGELGALIMAQQALFFPLLGITKEWFQQYMIELEPSRNVVCHMNRLKKHNVQDLEVKAERWREIVESIKDKLPAA
jgi:hypothetical protein